MDLPGQVKSALGSAHRFDRLSGGPGTARLQARA